MLFIKQGKFPRVTSLYVSLLCLSLPLIFLDAHHKLQFIKPFLNLLVAPFQYTVNAPVRLTALMGESFSTQKKLLRENESLRMKLILLEVQAQKLLTLENENNQLQKLLSASSHFRKDHLLIENLLQVVTDSSKCEVVLNAGKKGGVMVGQPVLDANGIMGQVIQTDFFTSRVLLITDLRSAIPIQDLRSDVRGILQGQGNSLPLLLRNLSGNVDIKVNDVLVSSGLGGCYPQGYPVGIVSSVVYNPRAQTTSIEVNPIARLDKNQPVLLIAKEAHPETLSLLKSRSIPLN